MTKYTTKMIPIHLLRVLYQYTSFAYPATQTALVNYLNDLGIPCTRKTVGRNLKYLMENGVPIKRRACRNGGYYYDFENDQFLVRVNVIEKGEKTT